jgi:hypothetical protein
MLPFSMPDCFLQLDKQYPSSQAVRSALDGMTSEDMRWFAQLWLSEGIPHAFQAVPALFESVRGWLAKQVAVHPKDITLIGSGRIGFCMDGQNYGRPFGPHRDLDFSIISGTLFERMRSSFERWHADFTAKKVFPKNPTEAGCWDEDFERLPGNLAKGFVDTNKISYRYHDLGHVMWEFQTKLAATPQAPRVKKASVRVYRDWDAFVRQQQINLQWLRKSLRTNGTASPCQGAPVEGGSCGRL